MAKKGKKKKGAKLKKDVKVDFASIEKKWQHRWEKKKIFEVKERKSKKKFYVLEMFPYPSGSGLHMGHAFNYTIGDIYSRFKRMLGFNVLYPMGYDSLGLPAENAAIKEEVHPKQYTEKSIANFIKQQKSLGLSYDWTRLVITHDPEYYKWDQWIFLQMLKRGLAFRKKASVNYCKKCKTVLANEQVHDGKCWRHKDTEVEIRQMEQWFLKITAYAPELYETEKLKRWPDDIKAMQKNWVGESFGVEINFKINNEDWSIFTTRPDTIYGVTFMVISAQHPRLMELVSEEQKAEVNKFLKKIKSTSEKNIDMEKEGAFTGSYAINPFNGEEVPIYTGNFVVAEYGSGMVMAVPAHDERDFQFAKKYNIPIKIVIQNKAKNLKVEKMQHAYTDEGVLVDSDKFSGTESQKAIKKISKYVENKKFGKKTIQYRLKDWLISRQRYWGTPIPIIYCKKCGIVPVPEKELPVKLPEKVKFGSGNPLLTAKSWINVKCPKCKGKARRETDTMDTFVNSSWYFLRYTDSKNKKKIFDKKKAAYWMPIDQYIGGKEHACMHLIYFRFYTKFLRDIKMLKVGEPALKLFNQGMLHGSDGYVMSKSRGNVVLPEQVSEKYGIDTARLFLVSMASPDKDVGWSEKGIQGSYRFINRVIKFFNDKNLKGKIDARTESKLNASIKNITEDIENFKYNLAIIKLRELFDSFQQVDKKTAQTFLKLLHPFCPHITEELWEKTGGKGFISLADWPKANLKKINKKFEEQDKILNKLKEDINNIIRIVEGRGEKKQKIYVYCLPQEKEIYDEEIISSKIGKSVIIFSVSDKRKYDPTNKSKNAKPGKPAIYLE